MSSVQYGTYADVKVGDMYCLAAVTGAVWEYCHGNADGNKVVVAPDDAPALYVSRAAESESDENPTDSESGE